VTGKRFKYISTYKAPKDPAVWGGSPKKLDIKLVHSSRLGSARLIVGKYSGSQLSDFGATSIKIIGAPIFSRGRPQIIVRSFGLESFCLTEGSILDRNKFNNNYEGPWAVIYATASV